MVPAYGTESIKGLASAPPGMLVIGGDYRGLGVVRSLGRRGIRVQVLTNEHSLAAHSVYCERRRRCNTASEIDLIEFLCFLGENELPGWAILPTHDEAAAKIARNHKLLSNYFLVGCAPWEKLQWAYDKRLTYRAAVEIGLDIPRTWYPRSKADVAQLPCSFPALLKPAIKSGYNDFVHRKGWIVSHRDELLGRYERACALVDPDIIMVQELIPGGGEAQFSYSALCQDGEPLASITAQRKRQYPLDLGLSSSYVESIQNDRVTDLSYKLLKAISYTGIVELEFKYDAREDSYKLLDANPRVWGWHSLAQRAGVDFPYLYLRLLRHEAVEPAHAATGIRWVRMLTDVPSSALSLLHGKLSMREYVRSLSAPLELATLVRDDPFPFFIEFPLVAFMALRRLRVHAAPYSSATLRQNFPVHS